MAAKDEKRIAFKKRRALRLIEEGNLRALEGDIEDAIQNFGNSIHQYPTAEAYAYLAWMLSFLGQIDDAIDLCRQAILIDKEFGNPYNDIGSYLIAQGKLDEAIPWLVQAKVAKRYEPRHFPYINLGKIYLEKGDIEKAIQEFGEALRLDPKNRELKEILDQLNQKAA